MAGYTGEKRWRSGMNPNAFDVGVSELTNNLCSSMLDSLTSAEAAFAEMADLYQYAGGTIQDLANLLFTEDIAKRGSPGTNAVITVDVDSSTEIVSATIDTAGTGYTDGNYQLSNIIAGISGSKGTINYTVSGGAVTSVTVVNSGTGYEIANDQVVSNFPLAGFIIETTANSEEVAKTQAAFDAITALHELYQCANNTVVAQEDRLAQLRRMT